MKWTLGDNHEKTLVDFSDVNAATRSGPSLINSVKKNTIKGKKKRSINKPQKKSGIVGIKETEITGKANFSTYQIVYILLACGCNITNRAD